MAEVEASLECYLAALHSSLLEKELSSVCPSDQKENLIGLMKEATIKLTNVM